MEKTYNLSVNKKQLETIKEACEFLSRVKGGQFKEVFRHLPIDDKLNAELVYRSEVNASKHIDPLISKETDLEKYDYATAWDIYQVIRHKLSWQKAVEDGIVASEDSLRNWSQMVTVNYDDPIKTGTEPLPTITDVNLDIT